MRERNLNPGDPLTLTISADARLSPVDYCDDHVWQLFLGGGEPSALALQTTFGLRARALRMFPRFCLGDQAVLDPSTFAKSPTIQQICPNYLLLRCSPFQDIDVELAYWVPHSHTVCGRIRVMNQGSTPSTLRLEWVGQLSPTEGQRMAAIEIQAASVLCGQTAGLYPVVFAVGGPQPGSGIYPSLAQDLILEPGEAGMMTWAEAALGTPEESFELARSSAARDWEAELARITLLNAGQVEIFTGNLDWDMALELSQKQAFRLFVGPGEKLPHPSFVLARQPDHGFSLRGDGSDYNFLWNGQPPLEAYYLCSLILPAAPHLAAGLLRNYLAIQEENGFVDWKPGLAGQRSRMLATPLLASIAWRIYETTQEIAFLEEVFPALLRFTLLWFSPEHDRDGDGVPEWDHLMQTGLDDSPLFSYWHPWSQGLEISTAESPALCSFLYQECRTLIRIAQLLGRTEPVPALQSLAEHLATAVETSWDPSQNSYQYWDRETHISTESHILGERRGTGEMLLHLLFDQPARLLLHIETDGETTRRPDLFIHGTGISGNHRVEHVGFEAIKWHLGRGWFTGERVYAGIEKVIIQGVEENDRITLQTAGYSCLDQSTLLPLWAGIPDKKRASRVVKKLVVNPKGFWKAYGMPACLPSHTPEAVDYCSSVHMSWTHLIGEGLLRYGYQREAAELVSRVMTAMIASLKIDHAFRRTYHAEQGQGSGEQNALSGLAPVGLFLETLGVRLYSPHRVALRGFNPFPWPVTVKYRGMTILRQKEKSVVIFPDGQTVNVDDPKPRMITLESDRDLL